MRSRGLWVVVASVALAVAVAVAIVGLALGGGDESASTADFEAAVMQGRDRVDFSLGRLSQATTLEELLNRMDEAAATIEDAAGELEDADAPEQFSDEQADLVDGLNALADDIQGTADQARVPGFESILQGGPGLNFPGWDTVNAALVTLNEQGLAVQPLERKTT
jgi:uncharacterized phage infection (PIP) family protein YhgE